MKQYKKHKVLVTVIMTMETMESLERQIVYTH